VTIVSNNSGAAIAVYLADHQPGKAQALAEVQAAAVTGDLTDITHALQDDPPANGLHCRITPS
jgi:hypothetical protein